MECAECKLGPSDHHEWKQPDVAHLEAFSGRQPVIARVRVLAVDEDLDQLYGYYRDIDGSLSVTSTTKKWFYLSRCVPWRGAEDLQKTYPEFYEMARADSA